MPNAHHSEHPEGFRGSFVGVEQVTISTDSNGDGSATADFSDDVGRAVTYKDGSYGYNAFADSDGDLTWQNPGPESVDIHITGSSTTGGEVTVFVWRISAQDFNPDDVME